MVSLKFRRGSTARFPQRSTRPVPRSHFFLASPVGRASPRAVQMTVVSDLHRLAGTLAPPQARTLVPPFLWPYPVSQYSPFSPARKSSPDVSIPSDAVDAPDKREIHTAFCPP